MLKRRLAAILNAAAILCTILALTAMLCWAAACALSDRFFWSQFPAYIPAILYAAFAAAGLALAGVLNYARRRLAPAAPRPRLLRLATLGLVAQLGYLALLECRIYRLVGREDLHAGTARPGGLRILYWNASATSGADLPTTMNLVTSDLLITANPVWERPFSEMAERFGPSWYVSAGQFVVLSRNPVLRWGATTLGLSGRNQVAVGPGEFDILPRGRTDTGHALWMEIDTRQTLGRSIVVWVLDLPSDERAGRWLNAGLAASKLHAWPGPACIPDGRGGVLRTEPTEGFPPPDLVVGDLNTPRGSASLSLLAPGLDEVYAQGGAGYAATFPRRHPLVHIDLMLAAPWLRGADYRIIDPGRGSHRMQWARLHTR